MKTYNKLVRDKIPAIIEADGKTCDFVIAPKEEMGELLEKKLMEEVNEYLEDKNLEELADVMEVLFGLAKNLGYSEEELMAKRRVKLEERGRFSDGVVLRGVNNKKKPERSSTIINSTLEDIGEEEIICALGKINKGLEKYQYIMKNFRSVDVFKDYNFRRKFNGFYRVRRNEVFMEKYYSYMEDNKDKEIKFEDTFKYIYKELGRVEASFSSKLVATINPNLPILDSMVLGNIGIRMPGYYKDDDYRIEEIIKIYYIVVEWYEEVLKSNKAKDMIKMFDEKYPDSNISEIKKIDFILWQIR